MSMNTEPRFIKYRLLKAVSCSAVLSRSGTGAALPHEIVSGGAYGALITDAWVVPLADDEAANVVRFFVSEDGGLFKFLFETAIPLSAADSTTAATRTTITLPSTMSPDSSSKGLYIPANVTLYAALATAPPTETGSIGQQVCVMGGYYSGD
jgi:hypothetical protein